MGKKKEKKEWKAGTTSPNGQMKIKEEKTAASFILPVNSTVTHKPAPEAGVISDVAQPGLSYCLPQLAVVPRRQHPHQNFREGRRLIWEETRRR